MDRSSAAMLREELEDLAGEVASTIACGYRPSRYVSTGTILKYPV